LHVVDRALVFDHWHQRLFVVAHVPTQWPHAYDAGLEALAETIEALAAPVPFVAESPEAAPRVHRSGFDDRASPSSNTIRPDPAVFLSAVDDAKEHILAGDIFQVVLSRRTTARAPGGAFPVYRRLRITNPAPYMFFLRMADGLELAGSSPEPLVRVEGRTVSSRPIAGTRRRGATAAEDTALEDDLLHDAKERAEHAMLVDLARNDLGRVCVPGTVRPTELMGIERFSRVMHIVSTVEGELREDLDPLDALAATFPAGTVTGAPKRRAMEIIAAAEPVARGPYAGAVGYLSFAGDLDLCITIRTVVAQDGALHVQSGAGIVHDSNRDAELRETETKATAVLAAIGGASR
jgi:anthranilate synthase component 1